MRHAKGAKNAGTRPKRKISQKQDKKGKNETPNDFMQTGKIVIILNL